jgi:serine/threonine protein phosphatase PrpC
VTSLSFDHRASDPNEQARVKEAGGWIEVVEGVHRVNGQLMPTRAFGDAYAKPAVSAEPYVTALEIKDIDEFVILACDGVRCLIIAVILISCV